MGGLALGGSVLAACGNPSTAPAGTATRLGTVITQLLSLKDVTYAGWYLADKHGFYQQEGVESRLLSGGPNIPNLEGVVAGDAAQVGMDDILSVIAARSQGSDLLVIGAQFPTSPAGIVSLSKKPVRKAQDLVGIRIGAQPGAVASVKALFTINNLPLSQMNIVHVGRDPQPILDGVCDCMTCFVTSQPITLKSRGADVVSVTDAELGLVDYGDVLFARKSYIQAHRDALVHYLRATIKGWEWNEKHPTEAVPYIINTISPDMSLNPTLQQQENETDIGLMRQGITKTKGLFYMDPTVIQGPVYKGFEALGSGSQPPLSEWLDLSLLNDAYAGKTSLL